MVKSILIVLLFALPVCGQTTNFHVAGVIGCTGGLGYTSPDFGATAGTDWRHGKFAFSIDTDILRVRKNVGGSGYSMSIREHGRFYVHKSLFVQASARQWRYSVAAFSKKGAEFGGGVGIEHRGNLFSLSYSHEVWERQSPVSPSSQMKTLDLDAQFFLKKHLYLDVRAAGTRFVSQHRAMTGISTRLAVGLWF